MKGKTLRVPFPIRVLLSYLLIILVGALPTFVYLRSLFHEHIVEHSVKQTAKRTGRLVKFLSGSAYAERIKLLRSIAPAYPERITYIDGQGRVLFDSQVALGRLDNHIVRPEVMLALGRKVRRERFDPLIKGVGVARRVSKSVGKELVYVAMRMPPPVIVTSRPSIFRRVPVLMPASSYHVLRLSISGAQFRPLISSFMAVFRNSQAGAISIALLLSLMAAMVFLRPLQRVAAVANEMASGDYSVEIGGLGNDEVGDVGRALQQLSVELRKRLALAGASKVILIQIVQILKTPLMILSPDRKVVVINRAARELFRVQQEEIDDALARWLQSPAYADALSRAEQTEDSQKVSIEIVEAEHYVQGKLRPLRHPSGDVFGVFYCNNTEHELLSLLPPSSRVSVSTLSEVLQQGIHRACSSPNCGVVEILPTEAEELLLADVDSRLGLAVGLMIEGISVKLTPKAPMGLWWEQEELFVSVSLEGKLPNHFLAMLRLVLGPIGGVVELEAGVCHLKLPRA